MGLMIESESNRADIAADMDRARVSLRATLASAADADLRRRSSGTRWTNEELLYHMVFGFMVTRALLVLVGVFGRLPGTGQQTLRRDPQHRCPPLPHHQLLGLAPCRNR